MLLQCLYPDLCVIGCPVLSPCGIDALHGSARHLQPLWCTFFVPSYINTML